MHRYYLAGNTERAAKILDEMNRFVKSQPEETNTWGAEDLRWANMEIHPALDITVLRLLGGMEALDPVSSNQAAWRCFLSSSWGVPPVCVNCLT